MELRDAMAMHAPTEPQDWFAPTGLGERPSVSEHADKARAFCARYSIVSVESFVNYMLENGTPPPWSEVVSLVSDDITTAGAEYQVLVALCEKTNDALYAYGKRWQKESYVQWPYAWADAVLASRGED